MMRLIKLELLQCKYQYMTLMLVVLIGFFLVGFGGYHLDSGMNYGSTMNDLVENIYGITTLVFMMGVVILCFVVLVRVFSTFASSMFTHNGYLYNTLPVNSYALVGSKLTAAIIWLIIFGLLMFIAMMFMVGGILVAALLDNHEIFFELIGSIDLVYIVERCVDVFKAIFDGSGIYLLKSLISIISTISIGYTIITLVHLPFIQQLKRALRYILYLIVIVVTILAMDYIHIPFLEPWLVLTILGVIGYFITVYLVAHRIDVAG